jgi:hypothetical protein
MARCRSVGSNLATTPPVWSASASAGCLDSARCLSDRESLSGHVRRPVGDPQANSARRDRLAGTQGYAHSAAVRLIVR